MSGVFIPISKGQKTLIDENDVGRVCTHKWAAFPTVGGKFYAGRSSSVNGRRTTIYLHRFIIGAQGGDIVDHINRDRLDNRMCNLRIVPRQANAINIESRNAYGYRGVLLRPNGRYRASITSHNASYYGGTYDTAIEAARAYDLLAREHHGQFAWLNFPEGEDL